MTDNAHKTPFAFSQVAAPYRRAANAIQLLGKALPCSVVEIVQPGTGPIVTVKFEVLTSLFTLPNVTIPVSTSAYVRLPIQIGDTGICRPADTQTWSISALAPGTADLTRPANLNNLVFDPVSRADWLTVDPNVLTLLGPNGVTIEDMGKNSIIAVTPSSISLSAAGHSIVINSSGVVIDGRVFLTHEHSGVTPGGGDTGPVV